MPTNPSRTNPYSQPETAVHNPQSKSFTPEEISDFRNDTPGCANVIHLNNAGAGLMPESVTRAVTEHILLESQIGGYEAAALQQAAIKNFYQQAAKLLNTKARNIAFTANATDAYSRALSAIPFQPGDTILTSTDDFVSNQIQFLSLQKRIDLHIVHLKNTAQGTIDLNDLDEKLKHLRPRLLSITHIPTNSGLVQPVKAIGEIAAKYATWYILDACQSIGQTKLDVEELHCDFLSATCRKFLRGPRGTGLLYVSDKALAAGLEPLFIDMRGAEWTSRDTYQQVADAARFEDWEFPYALILGTAAAIEYFQKIGEDRVEQRVRELSDYLRSRLSSLNGLRLLDRGSEKGALVTFTIDQGDPVQYTESLLQRKINVVPSYRRFAVIDFGEKKVDWALRASPHYYNTPEELDIFTETLRELIH